MNNEKALFAEFARDEYGEFVIRFGGEWERYNPSECSPFEHLRRRAAYWAEYWAEQQAESARRGDW